MDLGATLHSRVIPSRQDCYKCFPQKAATAQSHEQAIVDRPTRAASAGVTGAPQSHPVSSLPLDSLQPAAADHRQLEIRSAN